MEENLVPDLEINTKLDLNCYVMIYLKEPLKIKILYKQLLCSLPCVVLEHAISL
jgi:hypothetical protein